MKVFVAGPRAVTKLNTDVESRLSSVLDKGFTVLVGDANGVDRLFQQYMKNRGYKDVIVYASNGTARNNLGCWPIRSVDVAKGIKGFDFYACKDKQMANDADYGFMVWNGKSKGTLNNVMNLTREGKKVLLYFIPHGRFYCIDSFERAQELARASGPDAVELLTALQLHKQEASHNSDVGQMTLFG